MPPPDRSYVPKTFVRNELERLGYKCQANRKFRERHRVFHAYAMNTGGHEVWVANTGVNSVCIRLNDKDFIINCRKNWVDFRDQKLLPTGSAMNPIVVGD
jgi:hypothetical protein